MPCRQRVQYELTPITPLHNPLRRPLYLMISDETISPPNLATAVSSPRPPTKGDKNTHSSSPDPTLPVGRPPIPPLLSRLHT